MYIRNSYKNIRIPSPILKHVLFLMQEIPARTTLLSLYGNMQHLPKINIMTYHIISGDDLPYYIGRIQRRKRYVKLRWFDRHFPDHEVIVEIDNPNSIHAFNRFEEEGHAERKYNHFRLIDLTREELYAMGVPAILDDEEEE